jgi:hypothetical protein
VRRRERRRPYDIEAVTLRDRERTTDNRTIVHVVPPAEPIPFIHHVGYYPDNVLGECTVTPDGSGGHVARGVVHLTRAEARGLNGGRFYVRCDCGNMDWTPYTTETGEPAMLIQSIEPLAVMLEYGHNAPWPGRQPATARRHRR